LSLDKDVREILIRGDRKEIEDNKKIILEYCASDVIYLNPHFKNFAIFIRKLEFYLKPICYCEEIPWPESL
jgi:hypothetical protein